MKKKLDPETAEGWGTNNQTWGFFSKEHYLSGTRERTGVFQVWANMGSHFKNCHKKSAKKSRAKSGPVPRAFLALFLARVPKNSAHFSEWTAEKSAKNERERKLKKRAHGMSVNNPIQIHLA